MRFASQRVVGAPAAVVVTVLGCLGGPGAPTARAQTLFSVSRDDLELRQVDPTTGVTLSQRTMQCDPNGPFPAGCPNGGAWGLATDPTTGRLWVVMQIETELNRRLGTLDPNDPSAIVTDRGNLGGRFAGLAFDCTGNLYGVTDEMDSLVITDETLYDKLHLCTTSSCTPTLRGVLGNGDYGEAIAFDTPPMLYHASGAVIPIFEKILNAAGDLAAPNNIQDIGFGGGAPHAGYAQASAMAFWRAQDEFLISGQQNLFRISRTGAMTLVGGMGAPVNGLAFTGQACGDLIFKNGFQ